MKNLIKALILAAVPLMASPAFASSHREAPAITTLPKLDGTDFFMFRSYEDGRDGFVTIIANYVPLQLPIGGPNYFFLDDSALYEIHFDTDGDAQEDITFRFEPFNQFRNLTVPTQNGNTAIPLLAIGQIDEVADPNLNLVELYDLSVIIGDRDLGTATQLTRTGTGENFFVKPLDNAGEKTFPDYSAYANQHIFEFDLPTSPTSVGRVFLGQRDEPFQIPLGEAFDLVNIPDVAQGNQNVRRDDLDGLNITSFCLEIPISFLTDDGANPIIGAWTTARLPGDLPGLRTQVSRLGNPLVNELVIGLPDKNAFNASEPMNDTQFLNYVTGPTFPVLLEVLFGSIGYVAPTVQRDDLVQIFLTGIPTLNQPPSVTPGEMMRLNTGIAVTPPALQNPLGVIGGDNAGYPNGRRPGDDVVDITIRAASGVLLPTEDAPAGQLPFSDGVPTDAGDFDNTFPYLRTPFAGSPDRFAASQVLMR